MATRLQGRFFSPGAAGGALCKAARKPATITKIARARHAATTRQACDARGRRLDIVTCLGCPARAAAGPARVRVGDGADALETFQRDGQPLRSGDGGESRHARKGLPPLRECCLSRPNMQRFLPFRVLSIAPQSGWDHFSGRWAS